MAPPNAKLLAALALLVEAVQELGPCDLDAKGDGTPAFCFTHRTRFPCEGEHVRAALARVEEAMQDG